jgi:hypothetical protein
MPYLLAAFAIIVPILLLVQAVRGRVRVQSCCAVPADQDRRLSAGLDPSDGLRPLGELGAPVDRA